MTESTDLANAAAAATPPPESKPEKAPKIAPHEMWVYGPKDKPLLLAEGDEIPAGYKDHLSDANPNKE